MNNLKKYIKPKFSIIKFGTESLLLNPGSPDPGKVPGGGGNTGEFDAKAITYRIFDDSDDWSDEDY